MNDKNKIAADIRRAESEFSALYGRRLPFSPDLAKWQDDVLPDMYDHNFFEVLSPPSEDEIRAALEYQKQLGCGFLKLESSFKLNDTIISAFGFEESITLTMALSDRADMKNWKQNELVTVYDLKERDISRDLLDIETDNYGTVYGVDFIRRKMELYFELSTKYEGFHMFGAYLDGAIAGACYVFDSLGCAGLDGLIVSPDKRHLGVASTLMTESYGRFRGSVPYLHADDDDTPKNMYRSMGFQPTDRLFEYLLLF